MTWQPILTGELAAEARQAIASIAADIPRFAPSDPASLAGGAAGIALFYAYAGNVARADQLIDHAIAMVSEKPMLPALYGGFVGVAWALAHLQGMGVECADDAFTEIESALLAHVSKSPWQGEYDLISGLAGVAVYALERSRQRACGAMLGEVVARLDEISENVGSGRSILSPPELMPSEARRRSPYGLYNAGVAHGVPALIGVLGSIEGERARSLREGFATWLRATSRRRTNGSLLPYDVAKGLQRTTASRAAWCYGDPGAAAALLRGARAARDRALEELALELGRAAASRTPANAGVVDAGLCHGSAGLLHLFNRLYQATGDETFHAAALMWAKVTLAYGKKGGVGGYLAYRPNSDMYLHEDPGFLTGAAGIGLALLAATTNVEPCWDATLVSDVRPS